jgi:hypothetical protein
MGIWRRLEHTNRYFALQQTQTTNCEIFVILFFVQVTVFFSIHEHSFTPPVEGEFQVSCVPSLERVMYAIHPTQPANNELGKVPLSKETKSYF